MHCVQAMRPNNIEVGTLATAGWIITIGTSQAPPPFALPPVSGSVAITNGQLLSKLSHAWMSIPNGPFALLHRIFPLNSDVCAGRVEFCKKNLFRMSAVR